MNQYYFYYENNSQKGPVSVEELIKCITPETEIWTQGMKSWTKAKDVAEVAAAMGLSTDAISAETSTSDDSSSYSSYSSADSSTSNPSPSTSSTSYGQNTQPNPKTKEDAKLFAILSIVSCFVCCNSVGGIVAAIYAIVSEVYYNQGNYAEAEQKLKAAKIWFFVTLGVMVLIWVAYVSLYGTLLSGMMGDFKKLH